MDRQLPRLGPSRMLPIRANSWLRGARQPDLFPIQWWQLRYGLAVILVVIAWVSRELFLPEAGDRSPFMVFGLAVLGTALIAGFGPGLLASIMSSAIAGFFYLSPRNTIGLDQPFEFIGLGLFALEGLAAAIAGGLVRRSILRERALVRAGNRIARFLHHAEVARGESVANRRNRIEDLTERELEVARSLAMGLTNDEIGSALFVSRNTVKTHLKHIYEKLDVKTRTEAVARCLELGLLTDRERSPTDREGS